MRRALKPNEVVDISYTSVAATNAAVEECDFRRTRLGRGMATGLLEVDAYLNPAQPGELIGIIGRTSNYKSGFMQWWARQEAEALLRDGVEDEAVVYVTWEQAIEEMVCYDLAHIARITVNDMAQGRVTDEQMESIRLVHGPRRAAIPLYLVGHSIKQQRVRPKLTLSAVWQALSRFRTDFGVTPRAIFLDYLQQIEPEEGQDRQTQVFHNVGRCKDMALAMACPVIVGSQAKREAYDNKWGVPGITDSQWTSGFEHTCDKCLGVWYPITDEDTRSKRLPLDVSGQLVQVTKNLLVLQVRKQRFGPKGRAWPLYVDPTRNEIGVMATETMG